MENLQAKMRPKVLKIPTASPIISKMDNRLVIGAGSRYHKKSNSSSPIFDPYAENLDVSSPIIRYFHSRSPVDELFSSPRIDAAAKYHSKIADQYNGSSSSGRGGFSSRAGGSSMSPLSALENLETPRVRHRSVFGTPVKVDEDVLVMDSILVGSVSEGARITRSSSDSNGGGGASPSSSGKSTYKTGICVAWQGFGSCRYGSKCQFAHGKEELRPTRFHLKNKSETYKPYTSTYGTKCRFGHQLTAAAVTEAMAQQIASIDKSENNRRDCITTVAFGEAAVLTIPISTIKHENTNLMTTITTIVNTNWSPEDDGIMVVLPHSSNEETSSREDVNVHIDNVLYGSTGRRLSVFTKFCPD